MWVVFICMKEMMFRREKSKAKMEIRGSLLVLFTAIVGSVTLNECVGESKCISPKLFYVKFVFGTTSAYQVGGG